MTRRVRNAAALGVLIVSAVLALFCALAMGGFAMTPGQVLSALIGQGSAMANTIVVEWRLPRAVASLVFGSALAVSGAVFQSLTRNPLASPDVIGFSAGSFTGAIVVIVLFSHTFGSVVAGALVGGLVTALLVYLLSYRGGLSPFRLIIVGIGASAMLTSLNTWLLLRADEETAVAATAWGAGSLNETNWHKLAISGTIIAALLALLALWTPSLRQLELGDDIARSSGVSVEPARIALVVIAIALTAAVTAAAGPIAFIALASPQIARRVLDGGQIPLIGTALVGAVLLAVGDVIAEHAFAQSIPVGIVTVVLGGAYLVWLIIREGRIRQDSLALRSRGGPR